MPLTKIKKQAKMYQNYFLSLKYAENEKDYDIAGDVSLELFSNLYFIKKDTTAYKYLESAKKFYTLAENKNGLIEVSQMPAYVAFLTSDYEKSNTLLLEKLSDYKNIEDDAYYYLFATFLLTSNYSHLNDIENSKKYLEEFKSLKFNPTIDIYNYNHYDVSLNICMSHLHLANNDIDGTLHYLEKASKLRDLIKVTSISEYFSLYAEAYK